MARQFGRDSDEAIEARKLLEEEQAQKNSLMKKVRLGVGCGLAVIFLVSIVVNILHISSTSNDTSKVREDIERASQLYEAKLAEIDDAHKQIIEDDPIVNNATAKCKALCELQNELRRVSDEEAASNLGITVEHQKLLQDLANYNLGWGNDVTWSDYGLWYFDSVYDYEGTSLDVSWTCYDTKDTSHQYPLCIATATYDSETDMINNFMLFFTEWYRVNDSSGGETSIIDQPVQGDQAGQSGPGDDPWPPTGDTTINNSTSVDTETSTGIESTTSN